ncbi:MAG: ABC transporter substrate-binding protein [Nitrospiraceae bacterium]|nr:ABC transporter substrate-binding protein [Nitrospiraceae bacterium]
MISKRSIIIHSLLSVFPLFVLCFLAPPTIASVQPSPAGVIKTFNAALLEAMKKADELGYRGRYKLLEPVIRDTYALSFMAGQSTGRYWKRLTNDERESVAKAYRDWTIATYAGRFDGWSGEKFEVVSESRPQQGIVTVISKLLKSNGEEVSFHYLLRKAEGSWRVVDIQISGVSQLALTRAQFTSVIKTKGIKGLIEMLDEKIRAFERGGKKE